MNTRKAKRFWTAARVVPDDAGFGLALDGKPVRTPGKAPLILPTLGLAQAVADEWQAQGDLVDPTTMPLTRAANSAIDKVATQRDEVVAMLAAYGDADLTCYRAASPSGLVALQAAAWDPLLDWAANRYGARLQPHQGVIHVPQDAAALDRVCRPLHAMSPFELAAMHDLISLSGSLIIGLAVTESYLPDTELWEISRIDERWQQDQWGTDTEAEATAAHKKYTFLQAATLFDLSS